MNHVLVSENEILPDVCKRNQEGWLPKELMEAYKEEYPDCLQKAETIVDISLRIKELGNSPFVTLPFCHTVEAESLGASILRDEIDLGPRPGKESIQSLTELRDRLEAAPLNHKTENIYLNTMLMAVSVLREKDIPVFWSVTGPMTVISQLVESDTLIRSLRKEPEVLKRVLERVSEHIILMAGLGVRAGAFGVAFADPFAELSLFGEKNFKEHIEPFEKKILKALMRDEPEIKLHLCGRLGNVMLKTGAIKKLGTCSGIDFRIKHTKESQDKRAVLSRKNSEIFCGCIKGFGADGVPLMQVGLEDVE